MWKMLILVAGLLVAGCEYRYRYPCQDPANWEKKECQRPQCELDGECTDTLTNGVSDKIMGKQPASSEVEETVNE